MKKIRVKQVVGRGFLKDILLALLVGTAIAFIISILLKLMTGHDVQTLFYFMPRKYLFWITAFSYVLGTVFYMRGKRQRW